METLIRSSELEDPLEGYTGLALFPRTLSSLPISHNPEPYDFSDLNSTHGLHKSMPMGSSNELLKQAGTIMDGSSKSKTKVFGHVPSKDTNEVVAGKEAEAGKERRPGLGRKRAKFSFKPDSSQPNVLLGSSLELDIDNLRDPNEFFIAFERLENAKRESQKYTGVDLMDQNNLPDATKKHRPGLLRKSVTNKYHYSSLMFSQGTVEEDVLNSPDQISLVQAPDPNVASEGSEYPGSEIETDKKVSGILKELLARDFAELDGDGAVNLIQESFQMKPVVIEKLNLPDIPDVRKIGMKSVGPVLKVRNPLSDIHNLVKRVTNKTSSKLSDISFHSSVSPTPSRSPFSSISLLKKLNMQADLSSDPHSAYNFEGSPARNGLDEESSKEDNHMIHTGKLNDPAQLKSLTIEDHVGVSNTSPCGVAIGDPTCTSVDLVNNHANGHGFSVNVSPCASETVLDDDCGGNEIEITVPNETLTTVDADESVSIDGLHDLQDNALVQDATQRPMPSAIPDISMDETEIENPVITQQKKYKPTPALAEDNIQCQTSKTSSVTSPEHNEPIQESPRVVAPKKTKAKKKGRQSLAVFGTTWEGGKRKSNRIKSRPLEYWKGERFLYGRIHESLPTVIGRKYLSPGKKDGQATTRVESFVSDQYKKMLDLAAQC